MAGATSTRLPSGALKNLSKNLFVRTANSWSWRQQTVCSRRPYSLAVMGGDLYTVKCLVELGAKVWIVTARTMEWWNCALSRNS